MLQSVICSDEIFTETRKTSQHQCAYFGISSPGHKRQPPQLEVKGKAVPLQAWSGPEGSRKLGFPDFMTTAQEGGKIVSHMHRPQLPPGNNPGTHFC